MSIGIRWVLFIIIKWIFNFLHIIVIKFQMLICDIDLMELTIVKMTFHLLTISMICSKSFTFISNSFNWHFFPIQHTGYIVTHIFHHFLAINPLQRCIVFLKILNKLLSKILVNGIIQILITDHIRKKLKKVN